MPSRPVFAHTPSDWPPAQASSQAPSPAPAQATPFYSLNSPRASQVDLTTLRRGDRPLHTSSGVCCAATPSTPRSLTLCVRERLFPKQCSVGYALMLGWLVTTAGFIVAIAFWRSELFQALDSLSTELKSQGLQGKLIFGFLIFLTTFPPLPLYSTLIVMSGYALGAWDGFVVSWLASLILHDWSEREIAGDSKMRILSGAMVVFGLSRTLLKDVMGKCLANSPTSVTMLSILPKNPHLLFLIRLAPYPYNLLNVILASCPSLTFQSFTLCTALSLCKLLLHTWIGAGIHDLSDSYAEGEEQKEMSEDELHRLHVKHQATWCGILLCIALFLYLTHLARRSLHRAQMAQGDYPSHRSDGSAEEAEAFLPPTDRASIDDRGRGRTSMKEAWEGSRRSASAGASSSV